MTKEIAKLNRGASPLPWGRFFGWDPELIPNMPTLSADFLDEKFSSTFPVIIVGQSGHVAWVNHKAFEVSCMTVWISLHLSTDKFPRKYYIFYTLFLKEAAFALLQRHQGSLTSSHIQCWNWKAWLLTFALKTTFTGCGVRGLCWL